MTCVVGLVHHQTVSMGGDSAGSNDYQVMLLHKKGVSQKNLFSRNQTVHDQYRIQQEKAGQVPLFLAHVLLFSHIENQSKQVGLRPLTLLQYEEAAQRF